VAYFTAAMAATEFELELAPWMKETAMMGLEHEL
jgi:hypothetical protein